LFYVDASPSREQNQKKRKKMKKMKNERKKTNGRIDFFVLFFFLYPRTMNDDNRNKKRKQK